MAVLNALIFSLFTYAECPSNVQSIMRMACFSAPVNNCEDNLYHANGKLAYSKTVKNWFRPSGGVSYSNSTKNMFYDNGITAFSNTTKNWFHANGKTAYANTTKNWFHSNGKTAYASSTGTLYYNNGSKAGDYDYVIEWDMLDFLGINGCQ